MKRSMILFLLLPLLWVACEPEPADEFFQDQLSRLTGRWEWYKTTQALPLEYPDPTPENTGITECLTFTAGKTWEWSRNDTVLGRGSFTLGLWQDTIGGQGQFTYMDLYDDTTGDEWVRFYRLYEDSAATRSLSTQLHPYLGGGQTKHRKRE